MSTKSVTPNTPVPANSVPKAPGKKARPQTSTEKQIEILSTKKTMTPAEEDQLKNLRAVKLQDDLKRLATMRVQKVLDAMRGIQNLGRYKPTDEQTAKVFTAIKNSVNSAASAWQGNKQEDEGFSL